MFITSINILRANSDKASLADTVTITPTDFQKASLRAIEDWINEKYSGKVLPHVGLCVGFHSLIRSSEGLISHGDGLVSINVDFRIIVFRPFKGEIMMATITECIPDFGITLRTDFFEHITVPLSTLPEGTVFNEEFEVFIWNYVSDEGESYDYYLDRNERCLIRVEAEIWAGSEGGSGNDESDSMDVDEAEPVKRPLYGIQASMHLSGTGPLLWWLDEAESGGDAADEQADDA